MTIEQLLTESSVESSWITGGNFSGRSAILSAAYRACALKSQLGVTIPPEISLAISGLVPTVGEELALHIGRNPDAQKYRTWSHRFGLTPLLSRYPFSLSGGEQSLLALLCKLALEPRMIAIDGALEQLDPVNLKLAVELLNQHQGDRCSQSILLSHNGRSAGSHPLRRIPAALFSDFSPQSPPPPLDLSIFAPPPRRDAPTIMIRNGAFSYRGAKPVFSALNITLTPGRIHRLVGPNGSGKSTFARLITGILPLRQGALTVGGKPFDSYAKPGTLARMHFQSPDSQLFEDTVRSELASLPPEAADRATRFAGLTAFLDLHPFDLPFVLRKRLALTLILHASAPWLIFDEPDLGQDEQTRIAIAGALGRLAENGYGVILVTHNDEFGASVSHSSISFADFQQGENKTPEFSDRYSQKST